MMRARERLYLTEDKARVVRHGDPKAAFLYASEGDEIPDSAAEKFGLVDGRLKDKKSSRQAETLLGSSTLASTYDIGGKTVQLGALVAEAHKGSGLSVDQWNALPDAERDELIGKVLAEKQAGVPTSKPAAPPTPKPETPPPTKPQPQPAKKPAAKKAAAKKAA